MEQKFNPSLVWKKAADAFKINDEDDDDVKAS